MPALPVLQAAPVKHKSRLNGLLKHRSHLSPSRNIRQTKAGRMAHIESKKA
jgi:hypothetical protein